MYLLFYKFHNSISCNTYYNYKMRKTYCLLVFIILLLFSVKAINNYETSRNLNNSDIVMNFKIKRGVKEKVLEHMKIDCNVDVNGLINQLLSMLGTFIKTVVNIAGDIIIPPEVIKMQATETGGLFYSILDKNVNLVISAYYHPTKRHCSRAIGKVDSERSWAGPGEWSFAIVTRAKWGNKTKYLTCENNSCSNAHKRSNDTDAINNETCGCNSEEITFDSSGIRNIKYLSLFNISITTVLVMIWRMNILF